MASLIIIEPTNPSIAVHKGWICHPKSQNPKTELYYDSSATKPNRSSLGLSVAPRHYEFLSANETGDASSRKMVRSHVMKEYRRTTRTKHPKHSHIPIPKPSGKGSSQSPCSKVPISQREYEAGLTAPQSLGFPTAVCTGGYAFDMNPRMHASLSRYLTFLCQPVSSRRLQNGSHPLRSPDWFKFAVTDLATLHGMLYSGAVSLALLEGRTESRDSIYHLHQTISEVNRRLKLSTENVGDSTIGALSCVALGEALAGHREAWAIHMKGLKGILRSKAGTILAPRLIAKLHRTDITGAIDYSETPHLDFNRSDVPFTWSTLPQSQLRGSERDIRQTLPSCTVHAALVDIMVDVAHFSQAIKSWRSDPSTVVAGAIPEDLYWIEYRLLLWPTMYQDSTSSIDEACRLGALLHMKALLQEFPQSATGSSVLLTKLQASLQVVPITESLSPLLLWLSFIGAVSSKSDSRKRFMGLMKNFALEPGAKSLREHDLELSGMMALDQVFGESMKNVLSKITVPFRTLIDSLQRPVYEDSHEVLFEMV